MEVYSLYIYPRSTHLLISSVTHSSVRIRIMLVYLIWICPQVPGMLFIDHIWCKDENIRKECERALPPSHMASDAGEFMKKVPSATCVH